jgi:hypothetical protein
MRDERRFGSTRALAPAIVRLFASQVLILLLFAGIGFSQDVQNSAAAAPPAALTSQSPVPPPLVPDGFVKEPLFLSTSIDFIIDKFGDDGEEPRSGFYPEFSNMITGSGWISAGPGYRQFLFDRRLLIDGSAAISWRAYKMVQGRVELSDLAGGPLTLGAQLMWQDATQVNYFGLGANADDIDQSQYRLRSTNLVGYASIRGTDWLSVDGTLGWLPRVELMAPGGTFMGTFPDSRQLFPGDPAVRLARQPDFVHGSVSITADTRDYPGHPTSGGRYRAALNAYSDRTFDSFSFRQYEVEAAHFVPLAERRWVLALRGWTVLSDVASGNEVPFYLMPTLGGHSTLRSFHNFQFHDRHALLVNAESRWSLFTHVDAAVFLDAGSVARIAGDLNLDTTSVGFGIRVHNERDTIARLEVAHGSQGWQLLFRTSDPFRLSRGRRHVAAIPFTP